MIEQIEKNLDRLEKKGFVQKEQSSRILAAMRIELAENSRCVFAIQVLETLQFANTSDDEDPATSVNNTLRSINWKAQWSKNIGWPYVEYREDEPI